MDTRLHNDCDGGDCWACAEDERRAKDRRCDTCYWWLRDRMAEDEGICRRFRPSIVRVTGASYVCSQHSFENPASH